MPKPQKWFTSPLLRPGETVGIEWGWMFGGVTEGDRGGGVPAVVVEVSPRRVFRPTLRTRTSVPPTLPPRIPDPLASEAQGVYHQRYGETPLTPPQNLREHLHVHECDARSPLAKLKPLFPSFIYSPDMTDEDALWQPGSVRGRETEEELVERLGRAAEECLDKSAGATCECFVLGVSSTRLRTRASA
jgi:hypothetical protein